LLYYRLCWLGRGYGVRVSMHYLPGAVFGSKDHRNPQIAGGDILSSANLCVGPLYPHNAGKLGSHVLCYSLEGSDLAISIVGCATLLGLSYLLPSAHGRAKGVSEAYVLKLFEYFSTSSTVDIQRSPPSLASPPFPKQ
jgi:hypothetical protein